MKLVTVISLLILAVAVGAQTPCCGPKQFMAGNGANVGQVDPSAGAQGFFTYMYGAFDFTKRTFGYTMTIGYVNGTKTDIRVIQKYAQGSQWIIMDDVKYCEKQPAQQPEPNVCIPADAKFTVSYAIGGSESGLWADAWSYSFQRPKYPIDGNISVTVRQGNCYPISSSFIGARYDGTTAVPFVSTVGIMNLTVGIPDPDKWFTVPSFCNQEENTISSRLRRAVPNLEYLNFPTFF